MNPTGMSASIPFNRLSIVGREIEYLEEAIKCGHVSGDGSFTKRCHHLLEDSLGVSRALLTTSCTHALELAALLLDIQPGDEIIVPDYTFVSTINAFVLRGATPIFIDIRPDTLNLDERLLESKITPKTRAILPVHYAGVGCEMDSILKIANEHAVAVVEDNAHGLFGKYRGQYLGTFGCMAAQSFHETKNFSCGEGGALLINDPSYSERAEIIREKGTNRSRFFRGLVDKYSWVDIGSSYLPSDMLAGFLLAQLEEYVQIQTKRREIWETYRDNLDAWATRIGARLPFVPEKCEQSYHMFYLILPNLDTRQRFIDYMRERGILCVFHYLPLHLSDMGRRYSGDLSKCPVTEQTSDRLVRLPFYFSLSPSDQSRVIDTALSFSG